MEMARKCTVSADSLLLHSDMTSSSRNLDISSGKSQHASSQLQVSPDPGCFKRKISGSLSSDQIYMVMYSDELKHKEEKPTDQTKQSSPPPEKTSPTSPSKFDSSSSGPTTSRVRKSSVTELVLSGSGKLAKLLRRTHSAGCSKDIPSYALFLREKPMVRLI